MTSSGGNSPGGRFHSGGRLDETGRGKQGGGLNAYKYLDAVEYGVTRGSHRVQQTYRDSLVHAQ
jgi:hypothetical protein